MTRYIKGSATSKAAAEFNFNELQREVLEAIREAGSATAFELKAVLHRKGSTIRPRLCELEDGPNPHQSRHQPQIQRVRPCHRPWHTSKDFDTVFQWLRHLGG